MICSEETIFVRQTSAVRELMRLKSANLRLCRLTLTELCPLVVAEGRAVYHLHLLLDCRFARLASAEKQ